MVIADVALLKGRDVVDLCHRAAAGGATTVQLRWKDGTALEMAELARVLVETLPLPVLVNDRVDVALVAGAAGAHLGQDDLPLDVLRTAAPPGFLLGISVGSQAEAQRVRTWPADYWSVGPCYATVTKLDAGAALGVDGFGAVAQLAPRGMPVIGIGGITAPTVARLVAVGAAGAAVAAAVFGAPDVAQAASRLREALGPPR